MRHSKLFDERYTRFILTHPLFSIFSKYTDKMPSEAVPTAGVRFDSEKYSFEMAYNDAFLASLTEKEFDAVMKHEFYHIMLGHVTSRKPDDKYHKRWNVATDLAINSHISNLPKGALIPAQGPWKDLPSYKTAEWYFSTINADEDLSKAADSTTDGDDHSGWIEGDGTDIASAEIKKILAEAKLKKIINENSDQLAQHWGSLPQDVARYLNKLRATATVDWITLLKYFVAQTVRSHHRTSIRKINRKTPYLHPGRKVVRKPKIIILIDQSGSVSDALIKAFFAALQKLAYLATFYVAFFDTRVVEESLFEWKKGTTHTPERKAFGGTCFNAPTRFANKGNYDGMLIMTDMEASKPISSKIKRGWITTEEHKKRMPFKTNEPIFCVKL